MQISTKGRYALRFLLDLCRHQGSGSVSLKSIAERQGISKKYLEHVVSMLNPADLFQITRGYQGGYRLAKDPADITVADVLRVTEGGLSIVPLAEIEAQDFNNGEEQVLAGVWSCLGDVIEEYLEGITLQDLLDTQISTIEYYI